MGRTEMLIAELDQFARFSIEQRAERSGLHVEFVPGGIELSDIHGIILETANYRTFLAFMSGYESLCYKFNDALAEIRELEDKIDLLTIENSELKDHVFYLQRGR